MSRRGRRLVATPVTGVLVATSRREHTTSTVIVAGREPGGQAGGGPAGQSPALLIDPAWEPDELAGLAAELAALGLCPVAGLATHAHYDHLLWHPDFGAPPRWASAATALQARAGRAAGLAALGPAWPDQLAGLYGAVEAVPGTEKSGAAMLPWDGPAVQLLVHNAHVRGHTAAWLPDRGVLIAGDMLSDVELPLPDEGPGALAAYAAGLDALAPFARRAALVIPGHGSPTAGGAARLDADRRYLDAVTSRAPVEDPRLDLPGMTQVHAATLATRG